MYEVKKEHLDTVIMIPGVVPKQTQIRFIDPRLLPYVQKLYPKFFKKTKNDNTNTKLADGNIDGKGPIGE